MLLNTFQAIAAFAFATITKTDAPTIGMVAGNGGWDKEDSNHFRA